MPLQWLEACTQLAFSNLLKMVLQKVKQEAAVGELGGGGANSEFQMKSKFDGCSSAFVS